MRAALAPFAALTVALAASETHADSRAPAPPDHAVLDEGAAPDDDAPTPVEPPDDAIRFDLTAGTVFPLHLGLEAILELPYRIQIGAEIGWMPPGYVDAINAVSTGFGWYDATTASLVSASLENALVLRPSIGWRPFPDEGFEVRAGYTIALLGGGLSAAEAIEAVTGRDARDAGSEVPLAATAHGFQITFAWSFFVERVVLVRAELSYFQLVYSHTWIDASPARGAMAVAQASAALDAYLNDIVSTYVKTPTLSLFVGYRFE